MTYRNPATSTEDSSAKTVRIYEAAGKILGPIDSVRSAAGELYWSRHVIWHLFVRDFVAGFRQKLLGYLWIVLAPLIGIASFVFMQSTGILNIGNIAIPYPIFVFVGTTVWGLLIGALTTVANGLVVNADLVMRTNIPKIGLALTGMANICYGLLINLVVLALLLLVYGVVPSPWALLYPIAVLPIVLLGIGFGLILAVIGAVARDITAMFATAFNLLMYVTPVVYAAEFSNPVLQAIVRWNPLTHLVDAPRSLLVAGQIKDPVAFAAACVFALLVLWCGLHAFYLIKDKVAERL